MTVDEHAVALAGSLSGSVVLPGSPEYDDARLFHGRPGEPAAVIRVADADDVAAALAFAHDTRLPVAVRGGGHSTWESVPGAAVLDLDALRGIEVEADDAAPAREDGPRLVRVGGGATWGEVAEALAPHGLAISSGDTRSVGVGGLTLGGGIGWVVRCWGLAVDQLVGAQVVTADGRVLEVSASSEPELFWGLRGGGGNLGVVTRFDFLAHPLAGVVRAHLELDPADLDGLVRAFRDLMRHAPDELNGSLVRTPSMGPQMPSHTLVELAWAGTDEGAAREALAPFLALPQVRHAEVGPARYVDLLQEPPMPPPGVPMPTIVDQNGWFTSLDDDAVTAVAAGADATAGGMFMVRWLGGAFGRVDPDATAIAFRDAEAFVIGAGFVMPGAPEAEAERLRAALAPIAELSAGAYGNFTNSVEPGLPDRMYPPATLARLRALKAHWDPANLFTRNHNLAPAPVG